MFVWLCAGGLMGSHTDKSIFSNSALRYSITMECATEFYTLADYVIPRNNAKWANFTVKKYYSGLRKLRCYSCESCYSLSTTSREGYETITKPILKGKDFLVFFYRLNVCYYTDVNVCRSAKGGAAHLHQIRAVLVLCAKKQCSEFVLVIKDKKSV